MLDYIQRDYVNAVENGTVKSDFELKEMTEFSKLALDNFREILSDTTIDSGAQLESALMALNDSIAALSDVEVIAGICKNIKRSLLALKLVNDTPLDWPDLSLGMELYAAHCASCHGEKGDGKGINTADMEPKPSNFLKKDLHDKLAPFQVYNTIQLGLPGTSMLPFTDLSEQETWALSFYILSLPYEGEVSASMHEKDNVSLHDASVLSNEEIENKYGNQISISSIRKYKSAKNGNSLFKARKLIIESFHTYEKGDHEKAFDLALNAYLQGVEPVEQRLAASDADVVGKLEKSFMSVRTGIQQKESSAIIKERVDEAVIAVDQAIELIEGQEKGLFFTTFISASILIREGLEAFLIIISIIAILKSMNATRATYWIHAGWILAILVGASGYFFIDKLMNWDVSSREIMEGSLTLFACGVLIFMGFWLHSKTEITKWKKFVEGKISAMVNGNNMLGLAIFSFIVVFREAFESVIFLSSISVDSSADSRGIWLGVIIAALIVGLLSVAILKLFQKVNIRKVFLYSSVIIVVLAVILAGEGIHALQESGMVGVTSLSWNLRLGILGIYPTLESMSTQLAAVMIIVFLWLYNRKVGLKLNNEN